MNQETIAALSAYLQAMADDELVLGHRNSEWCGYAPILEEDIAFANIALDEIGHATLWYTLMANLIGEDPQTYPDRMAFLREPAGFRNIQLVELPIGDWAFSMLRQFFFDANEKVRLEALAESRYQPLAEAATKVRKEELYHYRHTSAWVKRLGLGTNESHRRLQNALDEIWPYLAQLFTLHPEEVTLVAGGYLPEPKVLRAAWQDLVTPLLQECGLREPASISERVLPRDEHTPHLKPLVTDMQSVARLDQDASW